MRVGAWSTLARSRVLGGVARAQAGQQHGGKHELGRLRLLLRLGCGIQPRHGIPAVTLSLKPSAQSFRPSRYLRLGNGHGTNDNSHN